MRIRSTRAVRQLVGSGGTALAELSIDAVGAESLLGSGTRAGWTEMEVELAADTDPELLDAVDKTLSRSGIDRAHSPSKLARALTETEAEGAASRPLSDETAAETATVVPGSAGQEVLRYVEDQIRALVDLDPGVRRDRPDSVHRMRVACRRLRSVLRSYRSVVDRKAAADPIREELKWLGNELAAERDQEVLRERLTARIEALPRSCSSARSPHGSRCGTSPPAPRPTCARSTPSTPAATWPS